MDLLNTIGHGEDDLRCLWSRERCSEQCGKSAPEAQHHHPQCHCCLQLIPKIGLVEESSFKRRRGWQWSLPGCWAILRPTPLFHDHGFTGCAAPLSSEQGGQFCTSLVSWFTFLVNLLQRNQCKRTCGIDEMPRADNLRT